MTMYCTLYMYVWLVATVTDSTFNSEELLCTEEEVLDLLQELDTSKPSGCDNISAKMLKCQYSSGSGPIIYPH